MFAAPGCGHRSRAPYLAALWIGATALGACSSAPGAPATVADTEGGSPLGGSGGGARDGGSSSGTPGSSSPSASASGSGGSSGGTGNAVVLAMGTTEPQGIAVDETNVYWTIPGDPGVANAGAIMKAPLAGGSAITLASAQTQPRAIAVDATNVYWVNQGTWNVYGGASNDDGTVMTVPLAGGTPIVLASGQKLPSGVAVDATTVYWTSFGDIGPADGTVMKVPLGGGAPTTIASGQDGPGRIAVDATSAYWLTGTNAASAAVGYGGLPGSVMSAPLAGGAPKRLASSPGTPAGIAVDATSVYFTDLVSGTVMKVPLTGGATITLASGRQKPRGIAVDTSRAYWAEHDSSSIMSVPLNGGAPNVVESSVLSHGAESWITLDATNVYFTTDDAILKIAK